MKQELLMRILYGLRDTGDPNFFTRMDSPYDGSRIITELLNHLSPEYRNIIMDMMQWIEDMKNSVDKQKDVLTVKFGLNNFSYGFVRDMLRFFLSPDPHKNGFLKGNDFEFFEIYRLNSKLLVIAAARDLMNKCEEMAFLTEKDGAKIAQNA